MCKGKKHLPKFIKNNFLKKLLSNNFIIILTYLLFQSCLYTNIKETIFKISLTILAGGLLMIFLNPFAAFCIAHLFNALFNGHLPAMFVHMGLGGKTPKIFINYIEKIQYRVSKNTSIEHAYAFGSLSRGIYKPTSDLDIRIVPKKDKWINSLFFLIKERTQALIFWFPLDIYAFDESELKIKMRSDEKPIRFKTKLKIYDEHVNFIDFVEIFKKKNLS